MEEITIKDLHNEHIQRIYGEDAKLSLSSVNYFIGKNGSGKTQALLALYKYYQENIKDLPKASVRLIGACRTDQVNGEKDAIGEVTHDQRFEHATYGDFYLFLKEDPIIEEEVNFYLKEFFNKEFQMVQEAGKDRLRSRDNNLSVGFFGLNSEGGGIKNFIALLTFILSPTVKALFIDEIEEGLNPQIIDFLISKIEEAVNIYPNKRFFINTHSPSAIYLKSEWMYLFFNRNYEDTSRSKICAFNDFGQEEYKDLPTELDPFRKQVFFSDTIILTEADTDYYIFNALAKKIGYSGYQLSSISFLPTWGAKSMPHYFNFIKKIGKECICLADAGAESFIQMIPGDNKRFLAKGDILKYSRVFMENVKSSGKEENALYGETFGKDSKKKAMAIKEEVQSINEEKREEVEGRYNDVAQIIKSIFGSENRYRITNDKLCDVVRTIRFNLQTNFTKGTLGDYLKNELPKGVDVVKETAVEEKVKIAISFKGKKISTTFNLTKGNAILDPVQFE